MREYPKVSSMILNSEIFEDKTIVLPSKPLIKIIGILLWSGLSKVEMRLLFRSQEKINQF